MFKKEGREQRHTRPLPSDATQFVRPVGKQSALHESVPDRTGRHTERTWGSSNVASLNIRTMECELDSGHDGPCRSLCELVGRALDRVFFCCNNSSAGYEALGSEEMI